MGEAAESLATYKHLPKRLGGYCRIAKAIKTDQVEATSSETICAPIEAEAQIWGRGLTMLIDYGAAMAKLAEKPEIDGEDAASNALSLAEKLEWHTLEDDTTDALSSVAGILVQWLAREIRRDQLVTQAKQIEPTLKGRADLLRKNLRTHLEILCVAEQSLRAISQVPCAGDQCLDLREAGRRATLEHLRVDLRMNREELVDFSVSLAGFSAAHTTLVAGAEDVGGARDRSLTKKIKTAADTAAKAEKTELSKYLDCSL